MRENDANNSPSQNNDKGNSLVEYIRRAEEAAAQGDTALSVHLYLAAFEAGSKDAFPPNDTAVKGLRQAWKLACSDKERSMAEHIFEKLEPYLSADETALYAEQLQQLAFDKLEEFGLDKKSIEDVTQMLSQDYLGMNPFAGIMKTENKLPLAGLTKLALPPGMSSEKSANKKSYSAEGKKVDLALSEVLEPEDPVVFPGYPTYKDIVGYREAIAYMAHYGIGVKEDNEFDALISKLNEYHGLEQMPSIDTFLFKSPVREDANHFMIATLGEIDLPAVRMSVEQNHQGMPVLCVVAQSQYHPHLNAAEDVFEEGGVLILENIDLWGLPLNEHAYDGLDGLLHAQFSRGAREALNFIRSAVENPDVYVLASMSSEAKVEQFFVELLEPIAEVVIHYPTSEERIEVWEHIIKKHPSLQHINRGKLIKYSARLSRFDIYMAAREAVEDAYKESLLKRTCKSVSEDALFAKLAAYQPVESAEYKQLEEEVVSDFRISLADIDSLLKEDDSQ